MKLRLSLFLAAATIGTSVLAATSPVTWDPTLAPAGTTAPTEAEDVTTATTEGFLTNTLYDQIIDGKASTVVLVSGGAGTIYGGIYNVDTPTVVIPPPTKDTWMQVTGGAFQDIVGGSYIYNTNSAVTITGDTKLQISGATAGAITLSGNVIGGSSGTSDGSKIDGSISTVLKNVAVSGKVYGGSVANDAKIEISGNTAVKIGAGVSVADDIYGGSYNSIPAASFVNQSVISGSSSVELDVDGTFVQAGGKNIFGGSFNGSVSGSTVTVAGTGTFNGNIFGGSNFSTAPTGTNSSSQTSVTLNGGSFATTSAIYGSGKNVASSFRDGTLVTIAAEGVDISGKVFGGGAAGSVKASTVNVTEGTINAGAEIYGGGNLGNNVEGVSTVTISGGTFAGGSKIYGGGTGAGTKSGSTVVTITGGTFNVDETVPATPVYVTVSGSGSDGATVTGTKTLLFSSESSADLQNVVFSDFDEIEVAEGVAGAIFRLTDATLTKTGAGILSLSGALDSLTTLAVSEGTINVANAGALGAAATPAGVTVGAGATLSFSTNGSFNNAIAGTGNVTIASGTVSLAGALTQTGTTTVAAGATLNLNSDLSTGTVALNGTISGTGTLSADVSIGENAKVTAAAAGDVFNFNSKVTAGAALEKVGDGTLLLGANSLSDDGVNRGVVYKVSAGTLAAVSAATFDSVTLGGGTLGSSVAGQDGAWAVGQLDVTAGSTIAGTVAVGSATEGTINISDNSVLTVSGALTSAGQLSVVGSGALATATGGSINVGSIVFGDDFTPITAGGIQIANGTTVATGDATFSKAVNITGDGALEISGNATFSGGASSISSSLNLGAGGALNVAQGSTLAVSGSVTGSPSITKTGAGTLIIRTDLVNYDGDISAQGGSLRISNPNDMINVGDISVDGDGTSLVVSGSITKVGGTVSLTGGAGMTTSTGFSLDSGIFVSDGAAVTGALTINNALDGTELGGLRVSGTLSLIGGDYTFAGTSPAVSVTNLQVSGTSNLKFKNIGTIGSAGYVLVKYSDSATFSGTQTPDFSTITTRGRQTLVLENDAAAKEWKIKTTGTLVWDGAENWDVNGDSHWILNDVPGQRFQTDDVVEFLFTGFAATNKITVTEAVNVGGVLFSGEGTDARFTVVFNNNTGIGDMTTGTEPESNVTINSGGVIWESAKIGNNLQFAANTFSGGLLVNTGATLFLNNYWGELGRSDVTLAGTLDVSYTGDNNIGNTLDLANDFVFVGTAGTVSVGAGDFVNIVGAISGTGATLNKTGAGTLSIGGDATVSYVNVTAGTLSVGAGESGVSKYVAGVGTTINFDAGATFVHDGTTAFQVDGAVNFAANNVNMQNLEIGNGGTVGVNDGNGSLDMGGMLSDNSAAINSVIRSSGNATINGAINFAGGASATEKSSLTFNVASGTLTAGRVLGDANSINSTIVKTGAGTLSVSSMETDSDLNLQGGNLTLLDHSVLGGDLIASANSTLTFDSNGGTIGATGKTVSVAAGTTLNIVASGNVTAGALDINSDIAAAGRVVFQSGTATTINLNGAHNDYSVLTIGENSSVALEGASGVGVGFEGDQVNMSAGATLTVGGSTVYSATDKNSGVLNLSGASTINLATDNSEIRFSGLTSTAAASVNLTGSGYLELTSAFTAGNVTVNVGADAHVVLSNTSPAIATLGGFTGTGEIQKTGTGDLYITQATDFAGTVALNNGNTYFAGGTVSGAELAVASGAAVYITNQSAVIGTPGEGETAIAKELSGDGNIFVGTSGVLEFKNGSLDAFSGKLTVSSTTANAAAVVLNSELATASSRTVGNPAVEIIVGDKGVLRTTGEDVGTVKFTLQQAGLGAANTATIIVPDEGKVTVGAIGEQPAITEAYTLQLAGAGEGVMSAELTSAQISIEKHDAGTWTISHAANTFADATIGGGTLVFKNDGSAGTGAITLASASADALSVVRFENMTVDPVNTISGLGRIETASDMTLTGIDFANFSGEVAAEAGTLTVQGNAAQIKGQNGAPISYSAAESATLVVDTSADAVGATIDEYAVFSGAGNIVFNASSTGEIKVTKAHLDLTGDVAVSAGTLWLDGQGVLGTGTLDITDPASELRVSTVVLLNSEIKGAGTLTHRDPGSTFVSGALNVNVDISAGTLSIAGNLGTGKEMNVSGGAVLETAQAWDDTAKAVVQMPAGTRNLAIAKLTVGTGGAVISHAGTTSNVNLTIEDLNTTTGETLTLANGGTGSVFAGTIDSGKVEKIGAGKWTLSDYTSTEDLAVKEGRLEIQNYDGASRVITLGTPTTTGYLDISNFSSASPELTGEIHGSTGTVYIGDSTQQVAVNLSNIQASDGWLLEAGENSDVLLASDVPANIKMDAGAKLTLDVASGATRNFSGEISMVQNSGSEVVKSGDGELVLKKDLRLDGDLAVKAGTLTVEKTLGKSSTGKITIDAPATLKFTGDKEVSMFKNIEGAGTIEIATPEEVNFRGTNNNFTGTIKADSSANIVLGGSTAAASFGSASVVLDAGSTLTINQKVENTISNLSAGTTGAGTLVIDNDKRNVVTKFGDTISSDIDVKIKKGVLSMGTSKWAGLTNSIALTSSDGTLGLTNDGAAEFELTDRANLSGTAGTISLSRGTNQKFAVSGAFAPAGVTVQANAGTTLRLAPASQLRGGLTTLANSTLDLTEAGVERTIVGAVSIAGALNAQSPASRTGVILSAAGAAVVKSTALVTVAGITTGQNIALVSATSGTVESGARFVDENGERLYWRVEGGDIIVSLAALTVVVDGESGLSAIIGNDPGSSIYAIVANAEDQEAVIRSFSPVGYAGLLELSSGFAHQDMDLLRERLEQRRYDRGFEMDETTRFKPFVNIFGSNSESDGDSKSATYDLNHYGVVAGFDSALSSTTLFGVSVGYDRGSAKMHDNGGKHEMDAARLGVYGMAMLDEYSYLGFSASFGSMSFDTKRQNSLETIKGSTDGTDVGISLTAGRMFPLADGLHISPYVGADIVFSSIDEIDEDGGESSLSVDKLSRTSIRGVVGATLNWLISESVRIGIEANYKHEFADNEYDVDAKFNNGTYSGQSFTSTAYLTGQDSVSVGPHVEFRLSDAASLSASYTFETDLDAVTTHSANIGVRLRF